MKQQTNQAHYTNENQAGIICSGQTERQVDNDRDQEGRYHCKPVGSTHSLIVESGAFRHIHSLFVICSYIQQCKSYYTDVEEEGDRVNQKYSCAKKDIRNRQDIANCADQD